MITHIFADGRTAQDINGLRVPYTAETAAAYKAVAEAQTKREDTRNEAKS